MCSGKDSLVLTGEVSRLCKHRHMRLDMYIAVVWICSYNINHLMLHLLIFYTVFISNLIVQFNSAILLLGHVESFYNML